MRILGFILISVAILITLTGLFYAEENWRGKRAWENYRHQAEARGVELDFHKITPPPVPDDQNFAMTPFLAPMLDFNPRPFAGTPWRDANGANRAMNFGRELTDHFNERPFGQMTDLEGLAAAIKKESKGSPSNSETFTRSAAASFILNQMNQYQSVLDEIRTAGKRPYSRFNVHYEDKDPAAILLPHLAVVRRLGNLVQIRASAELALNQTDSAFEDVHLIFRLADSIHDEPIIISQLVRIVILNAGKQIIWEGLAKHAWSDAQLQDFQKSLGTISALKDMRVGIGAERAAFGVNIYDLMRDDRKYMQNIVSGPGQPDAAVILLGFAPRGWLYQEQVVHQKLFDDQFLPAFNADNTQIQPKVLDAFSQAFGSQPQGTLPSLLHHHVLARLLLPSLGKYAQKSAFCQTTVEEAVIACGLERHRLANRNLPEKLDLLVPKYLSKMPVDICTGQPLQYHRTDDGQFLLYSVGWNLKDDGGLVVMTEEEKKPILNLTEGDWVWPKYDN